MTITFDYNQQKAFQVILWFLGRHGERLEKLKLVKLIFFADREHLHRYGRPIVGGRYVAMPLGPVASQCLDDMRVKQEKEAKAKQEKEEKKES